MTLEERSFYNIVKEAEFAAIDLLEIANRFNTSLSLKAVHRVVVKAGAIPRYCGRTGKTIYFKRRGTHGKPEQPHRTIAMAAQW
jgi:hypothetical protein